MQIQNLIVGILIITGAALSIALNKLTKQAACAGGVIAAFLYIAFGPVAIAMLAAFFVTASIATRVGIAVKLKLGLAEKNSGRRTTGQVFANGGAAGAFACAAMVFPGYGDILRIMAAASIASATSDTLSSELGNVYGTKFYNILTFEKARRGDNGVVSGEGFCWGIVGSAIISGIYAAAFGFGLNVIVIFVAGVIGNVADSILGELLENQGKLTNNQVNGLNTLIAGVTALPGLWLASL